jgi:5,10-methylenetetrahydromethanopterin reductase
MLGIELTPEHPLERVVELGTLAEAEGFESVFVSHHYNNRDAFAALSRLAHETETVSLGPGVVNPYETHPVALASRVATLAESSDGRAVFGVGAGDRSTLSNLGVDREAPLRRVLETVRVARRLFDGERVDHDGTFEARDAGLNYDVGEVPIYVGAQGPDMLRMGAKHADGVLFNGAHPRDVDWAADRVAEGRKARPATHGEFSFLVYASVSVADSADAAREAARPPVAFIAAGAPEAVLNRHDLDHARAAAIGDDIAAGDFEAAFAGVSDAMLSAFCVAGTPETVGERLETLLAAADGVVASAPLGPDLERAIRLAADAWSARSSG